jgi:hypothetical protein
MFRSGLWILAGRRWLLAFCLSALLRSCGDAAEQRVKRARELLPAMQCKVK